LTASLAELESVQERIKRAKENGGMYGAMVQMVQMAKMSHNSTTTGGCELPVEPKLEFGQTDVDTVTTESRTVEVRSPLAVMLEVAIGYDVYDPEEEEDGSDQEDMATVNTFK
jgi:hypothetical protein